jgi:hypothetical protein
MKKLKYNAMYVENEDSVIALLNEELDIDSDDQLDLENVEESASEEKHQRINSSVVSLAGGRWALDPPGRVTTYR